jgi:hypothetical protein
MHAANDDFLAGMPVFNNPEEGINLAVDGKTVFGKGNIVSSVTEGSDYGGILTWRFFCFV